MDQESRFGTMQNTRVLLFIHLRPMGATPQREYLNIESTLAWKGNIDASEASDRWMHAWNRRWRRDGLGI
jgi:hypothetical protein